MSVRKRQVIPLDPTTDDPPLAEAFPAPRLDTTVARTPTVTEGMGGSGCKDDIAIHGAKDVCHTLGAGVSAEDTECPRAKPEADRAAGDGCSVGSASELADPGGAGQRTTS
ncbi:hypothetical protein GCM10022225_80380 [Plantactinospora mayteni]|uniref:Uncharacterized protein n=1 Tax=Plantactinospora mayteni TaxID=566021 RepID=A0ABQ4F3A0_9ACTN|nr:hypothetical protein [Plantactinospora mayteni]GIH01387.1 hypothetical protein Pma05_79590 [Plantactinospora mayteni]